LQPTAFGAQDRRFFDAVSCRAPRPQLNGNPLGRLFKRILSRDGDKVQFAFQYCRYRIYALGH
jgi:hypothetical protein